MAPDAQRTLVRFMLLSIAAAVVTIGLKVAAAGDHRFGRPAVGRDRVGGQPRRRGRSRCGRSRSPCRPPDLEHHFGHGKAEYLSAAFEGAMILVAAARHHLDGDRAAARSAADRGGRHRAGAVDVRVADQPRRRAGAGARRQAAPIDHADRRRPPPADRRGHLRRRPRRHRARGHLRLADARPARRPRRRDQRAVDRLRVAAPLGERDARRRAARRGPEAATRRARSLARRDGASTSTRCATREAGRQRFVYMHVLVPDEWTVKHAHDVTEQVKADDRRGAAGRRDVRPHRADRRPRAPTRSGRVPTARLECHMCDGDAEDAPRRLPLLHRTADTPCTHVDSVRRKPSKD